MQKPNSHAPRPACSPACAYPCTLHLSCWPLPAPQAGVNLPPGDIITSLIRADTAASFNISAGALCGRWPGRRGAVRWVVILWRSLASWA